MPSTRGYAALPYGFHKLNLSRKRTVNLYVCSCAWLIESKGFPAKNSPTIHLTLALHVYRTKPEKNNTQFFAATLNKLGARCPPMGVPCGCPLWQEGRSLSSRRAQGASSILGTCLNPWLGCPCVHPGVVWWC